MRGLNLGLSWPAIIILAALAAPRIIAHDLDLVSSDSIGYLLMVFVPPAVWIAVVIAKQVPQPFMTLLAIGGVAALYLAVLHQVLWTWAFDEPPALGGNLEGRLPWWLEATILRTAAFVSSLATGAVLAVVVASIGWLVSRAQQMATRSTSEPSPGNARRD